MNYNVKEIISYLEETELVDYTHLTERDFDSYIGDEISESLNGLELDDTEWFCNSGATKGVLIPDEGDYVIKIPFSISPHKGFRDYCELEQYIYYKAVEGGVSKFFAKIVKIGEVNGLPIYVQERAMANYEDWMKGSKKFSKEISKKSLRKMKKFCKKNKTKGFNLSFLSLIKERENEETFLKLYKFMKKNINDVHAGNIGMIEGNPVLIDYSGFYG